MGEKYKLLGNFEKILKFLDKISFEKLNFYLFLSFIYLFGKVVARNRAFGNNINFLQQFLSISVGERSLCPPTGGAYVYLRRQADVPMLIFITRETPLKNWNKKIVEAKR